MNHLDDERIAAFALDDAEQPTPGELEHLEQCDRCGSELAELRRLVSATGPDGDPLVAPPAHVWAGIAAALDSERAGSPTRTNDDDQGPIPIRSSGRDDRTTGRGGRSRDRNWWTIGLVAALIGLLVGALGTVAIRTIQAPAERVVADIPLEPLPGKAGAGEATLVQTADGLRLRVTLSGIRVSDADLEVWLINTDGERMRSLGLAADGGGTFNVPGWMIPDDYRIVDVSVEPHDGDLAHSTDSEVRGTLP
jgi:anti-sigma-K factor RskA